MHFGRCWHLRSLRAATQAASRTNETKERAALLGVPDLPKLVWAEDACPCLEGDMPKKS